MRKVAVLKGSTKVLLSMRSEEQKNWKTVRIRPSLHRRLKYAAAMRDMMLQDLAEAIVKSWLKTHPLKTLI